MHPLEFVFYLACGVMLFFLAVAPAPVSAHHLAGHLSGGFVIEVCGASPDGSCRTPTVCLTDGCGTAGGTDRVQVKNAAGEKTADIALNPAAPVRVPSGWAPGLGGANPAPPGTAGAPSSQFSCPTLGISPGTGCASAFGTWEAACSAAITQMNPGRTQHLTGSTQAQCRDNLGSTYGPANTVSICPTGYSVVSGVCTLSNAALVKYPDGTPQDVRRSGNTFSNNSANSPAAEAGGVSVSGATVTASTGSPSEAVAVTLGSDGSATITQTSRTNSGNTRLDTFRVEGEPDGSGQKVVGHKSEVHFGDGSFYTPGTAPPPLSEACGLPGKPACRIDETGTATGTGAYSAASSSLDTHSATRADAITTQGGASKVTDFGWGFGLELPTGTCTAWTFNIKGVAGSVDWCPWLAKLRDLISWFFGACAALYIWKSTSSAPGRA